MIGLRTIVPGDNASVHNAVTKFLRPIESKIVFLQPICQARTFDSYTIYSKNFSCFYNDLPPQNILKKITTTITFLLICLLNCIVIAEIPEKVVL